MIDGKDKSDIYAATKLNERINILYEEIDVLLNPILKEYIKNDEINDLNELLEILPNGFHRSELRTHMYEKGYLKRLV